MWIDSVCMGRVKGVLRRVYLKYFECFLLSRWSWGLFLFLIGKGILFNRLSLNWILISKLKLHRLVELSLSDCQDTSISSYLENLIYSVDFFLRIFMLLLPSWLSVDIVRSKNKKFSLWHVFLISKFSPKITPFACYIEGLFRKLGEASKLVEYRISLKMWTFSLVNCRMGKASFLKNVLMWLSGEKKKPVFWLKLYWVKSLQLQLVRCSRRWETHVGLLQLMWLVYDAEGLNLFKINHEWKLI